MVRCLPLVFENRLCVRLIRHVEARSSTQPATSGLSCPVHKKEPRPCTGRGFESVCGGGPAYHSMRPSNSIVRPPPVLSNWPNTGLVTLVLVKPRPTRLKALMIGIGAAVTRRPLPHHRAYGSVHGGSSRLR